MDIKKWKEEWVALQTDYQRSEFDIRFKKALNQLSFEERGQARSMFLQMANEDLEDAKEVVELVKLRNKLEPILNVVSMSEISSKYFGKSRHWLYQRINGSKVNGVTAKFTEDDLSKLKHALNEISENMRQVALSI